MKAKIQQVMAALVGLFTNSGGTQDPKPNPPAPMEFVQAEEEMVQEVQQEAAPPTRKSGELSPAVERFYAQMQEFHKTGMKRPLAQTPPIIVTSSFQKKTQPIRLREEWDVINPS